MKPIAPVDKNPARQSWGSPIALTRWLNRTYGLTLDVCASKHNHVYPKYYDLARKQDGLKLPWDRPWFCNPPWEDIGPWAVKALNESSPGVMLVPNRTDRLWFRDVMETNHVCFITGRLKYRVPRGIVASTPSVLSMLLFFRFVKSTYLPRFLDASQFGGSDAGS